MTKDVYTRVVQNSLSASTTASDLAFTQTPCKASTEPYGIRQMEIGITNVSPQECNGIAAQMVQEGINCQSYWASAAKSWEIFGWVYLGVAATATVCCGGYYAYQKLKDSCSDSSESKAPDLELKNQRDLGKLNSAPADPFSRRYRGNW